jgi:hypothetical protein
MKIKLVIANVQGEVLELFWIEQERLGGISVNQQSIQLAKEVREVIERRFDSDSTAYVDSHSGSL